MATAFLGGIAMSLWAVSIPPAVAQLTTERARPFGFSVVFATGIGMGVVGGLLGGRLPALLGSKQAALLAGSAAMVLATIPASRLRFAVTPGRSGCATRGMASSCDSWRRWQCGASPSGRFNPFFNAYFATQLHAATDQIGAVFSASQLTQVFAVLLSPLILKKLGIVRGIASMQLVTAVALAALAGGRPAGAPARSTRPTWCSSS